MGTRSEGRCDRSGIKEVEASEGGVDKGILGDRDRAGRAVALRQYAEYPFDLSRTSNAIFRVNTLREVSELLPRPYRDAVVDPESCCGEIVACLGVFDVNRWIFGCCCEPLILYMSNQLLVPRSSGLY